MSFHKIRIHFIKIVLLAAFIAVSTMKNTHADEVIMKNGSRLIGTVISMESGRLVFKTSFAGNITIDWERVERLTTEKTVEVSLNDKKVSKGQAVKAAEGTLVLQPEEGPATEPISLADVKSLNLPKPPPGWEFDGRISLSASLEAGNTEKDKFNADGEMTLSKYPHSFKTYFETSLEKHLDEKTEEKGHFALSYEWLITDKWYVFGFGNIERDEFADLSHLVAFGAGPGYHLFKSDEKNLSIGVGPGYVIEKYTTAQESLYGQNHREYAAAIWAFNFDMYLFNRKIQPFHRNFGVISFEDSSVWRLRTRTGIRFPLVWNLFSTIEYNYDWVNSPAKGRKEYDEAILLKVGYKW